MIIDSRQLNTGERVRADVCVVGSGPAGMTVALELARQGANVCMLESGGFDFDEVTQSLAAGEISGDEFETPHTSRRRQFSGTANKWDSGLILENAGARCGALDEADFEERDWLPYSGWPFSKAHLDAYYERAHRSCGLGPFCYEGDKWSAPASPAFALDPAVVTTNVWQFGRQSLFTREYRNRIASSDRIAAYLHANVTEIETNENGTEVERLRMACLSGTRFSAEARVYILATGGIDNARLLLLSDKVQKRGLGNDRDLVGRFFMEHQMIRTGTLYPSNRGIFELASLYDVHLANGTPIMGKLAFTNDVLRKEKLLNASMAFLPRHAMYKPRAVESLKALLGGVRRFKLPARSLAHAQRVLGGIDFIGVVAARKFLRKRDLLPHINEGPWFTYGFGWSLHDDRACRYSLLDAYIHAEQAPVPSNRVMLSDSTDILGCRRARLHWQWDELSIQSALRAQELFRRELARAGIGDLRITLDGGRPQLVVPHLHHHMGTTRMHGDPRQGVVDANSRVHGVSNLFIGGCSVFPTGGYINPTLTIVALALRLADHVGAKMDEPLAVAVPSRLAGRQSPQERDS